METVWFGWWKKDKGCAWCVSCELRVKRFATEGARLHTCLPTPRLAWYEPGPTCGLVVGRWPIWRGRFLLPNEYLGPCCKPSNKQHVTHLPHICMLATATQSSNAWSTDKHTYPSAWITTKDC